MERATVGDWLGGEDMQPKLVKPLAAEFLGTLLFSLFGCACYITNYESLTVGLTFGTVAMAVIVVVGHISGAHINPAVTCAMIATRFMSFAKGILYIVMQLLGAVTGTAILMGLKPDIMGRTLGSNHLSGRVSDIQGFGFEFFLGMILLLVVFAVTDQGREKTQFLSALAIGLTYTLGHLATYNFTSTGMNPARSFASSVLSDSWDGHWVFWAGPILGGLVGAFMYTFIFAADANSLSEEPRGV
ncbi:aquaporin-1-like [Bacillus rossius redtenbacheri]|uniref:aquaporin-1-like n=1 Tax=Bacillus rossius redtenbacheri TaxID=93214 RepID=UPI002FDD2A6C